MAEGQYSEAEMMLKTIAKSVDELDKTNSDMVSDGQKLMRMEVESLTVQEETLNAISAFVNEKVCALRTEIADCRELTRTISRISALYKQKLQETLTATEEMKRRKTQVCIQNKNPPN